MKSIYRKIHTLEVSTNRTVNGLFAGNYRSSFQGSGIEVEDVRPYVIGDNAKNIDWVTTAKLGETYTKKFAETRELSTFIIVDVSPSMQFTSQESVKKCDVALEVAAILMFSALRNHEQVGAILFASGITKFIPAKKGKRHVLRILKEIIDAYDNSVFEESDVSVALDHFNHVIKKHPICFVITDTDEIDSKTQKALSITNLKNDLVYIHVTDPFEQEICDSEYVYLRDMETARAGEFMLSSKRLRQKYKELRQRKTTARTHALQQVCVDAITVSTSKKVFPILLNFFKRRQRAFHRV